MEAKKLVSWDERRTAELEALLSRFSGLMKVQIYKFNPGRYGLDPEDIAQEIKIKLWRVLSREKEIVNFPSYLRKVVNSSVIDMLRKIPTRGRRFSSREAEKDIGNEGRLSCRTLRK